MKWIMLAAVFVLLLAIHQKNRKKLSLSWPGYGKHILGLGPEGQNRKEYLDKLRFLAAMLVILVHSTQSAAARLLETGQAGWQWYILTGAAGLELCCNPLFVMISGALLIPCREESAGTFYRKRLVQVVLPLGAYYLFYLHRSGLIRLTLPSLLQAAETIIAGPVELVPHFWLIYVLIRLAIPVPLFRMMEKNLPDSARPRIAWAVFLGMAAKSVLYVLGTGFGFDTVWFSWEGMFLTGYVLSKQKQKTYDTAIYAGGVAAGLLITWIHCTRPDGAVIAANDSALMLLFSMAVFLQFLRREEKRKEENGKEENGMNREKRGRKKGKFLQTPVKPAVRLISRYSYSILLIHWFMLFVVAEKHLHIHPLMFGENLILAGVIFQSAAALLLSLVFAVIYDNTVIYLAEWFCSMAARNFHSKTPDYMI